MHNLILSKKSALASQFPDALIPHLETTLKMDWLNPPVDLKQIILTPQSSSGRTNEVEISSKCGEEAYVHIMDLASNKQCIESRDMFTVQSKVLGVKNVHFRVFPAYTHARRERYSYFSGVEEMFVNKVVSDIQDGAVPVIKAARLYLDFIYFHPFEDGNTRAAILWMIYVLRINNLYLPCFRNVLAFDFSYGNEQNYWDFVKLIAKGVRCESR